LALSDSKSVVLFAAYCILATAVSTTQAEAASRGIHYGAVSAAEILACDALQWRGEIDAAETCYAGVLRNSAPASAKAEAAWAMNDLQQANRWFQQALRAAPEDAATRVRWGDLYAASHQDADAMELYRETLETDPESAFASLGAARLLAGGFDDAANVYLEKLLSDGNAAEGARAGAWLLVARVSLENGNYADAVAAMNDAETVIQRNGWPPLDLYALRAALDLLNNVEVSGWTKKSLEFNPHFGDIYAVPAYFYVITRRYRGAIDLYQKAVEIEPGHAAAHEELGVNLLRDNQVGRAARHLETAHNLDRFSPKAVNTLRLLDSFSDFQLISDPSTPGDSELLPITLRLHEDEAAIIAPYAIALTRASIEEFTRRYDFQLSEPVIIEMYPDHEDFAVRTAGMPGIGILGATFGYVIAMDSPSSRPPEQFQWGTTLWHEMAHVFTLEASNHLVPRWFSEGVSVFEEWRSGPNRGVRIPMSVYVAMKDERFLPVANLDEGFIRPTYEDQIIVSYMQAGLICSFIDATYGADKLSKLLYRFRDGLTTAMAIEDVFAMPAAQFDREFTQYVQAQHGAILDNLEDWQRMQQALAEQVDAENWTDVPDLARQLISLLPQYIEPDSPYLALARAAEALGQRAAAMEALENFWQQGGYEPAALKRLADWLLEADRRGDAIKVLQSVNLVEPLDRDVHGTLGDMLLTDGRAQDALREFTVALALDPHDKATAYYRMAQAHHALGNIALSQDNLLRALDVAPNFRPAQRLLLEVARNEPPN
jgi:tetratricopeptide (TPR) repeat protein